MGTPYDVVKNDVLPISRKKIPSPLYCTHSKKLDKINPTKALGSRKIFMKKCSI